MEESTYDVIVTGLIMTLLIIVITIARQNMDIIQLTAEKTNDTDKVKVATLLPLNKNSVYGSDVISTIRFYSNDTNVTIKVNKLGGGSKTYVEENYNRSIFDIPYEGKFSSTYSIAAGKLTQAVFTQTN